MEKDTYMQLIGAVVQPNQGVKHPGGLHSNGVDSSAVNNPLRTPGSTWFYLCLPPIKDSVGSDYYFPITHETLKEKTQNKYLSQAGKM
jgi:hypothetical protein